MVYESLGLSIDSANMLFNFEGTKVFSAICGDYSEEDPPVPIPNTVVKLLSADDTWGVTPWEIRTSQVFFMSFLETIFPCSVFSTRLSSQNLNNYYEIYGESDRIMPVF